MDSLILCKFLRGVFADPLAEWAQLLATVTGWDVDADELATTARRIVMTKRLFNLREGWTREEDWLPRRFLSESLQMDSGREAALPPERLESMIDGYYRGRGLKRTGLPTPELLDELDLITLGVNGGQSPVTKGH
jgi:aldehyde:ferredoxin oxidoreductase